MNSKDNCHSILAKPYQQTLFQSMSGKVFWSYIDLPNRLSIISPWLTSAYHMIFVDPGRWLFHLGFTMTNINWHWNSNSQFVSDHFQLCQCCVDSTDNTAKFVCTFLYSCLCIHTFDHQKMLNIQTKWYLSTGFNHICIPLYHDLHLKHGVDHN